MVSAGLFLAFLLASLVLAATPGPGVVFVVTRTLAQGRRAGLASVAGVALGNLGNALGAAIGLATLFALSSLAFTVVQYAGSAYLVWLGVQALRAPAAAEDQHAPPPQTAARIVRDGALVALLNPKTALFFAAFLPQFIDPQSSAMVQSVLLGSSFVVLAACTDTAYVLAAHAASRLLGNIRRGALLGRYLSAAVFLGLGMYTVLSGQRAARN